MRERQRQREESHYWGHLNGLIFSAASLMRSISVCVSICLSRTNTETHQKIHSIKGKFIENVNFCHGLLAFMSLETRRPDASQSNGLFYLQRSMKAWFMWPLLIISKSSTKPHERFHLLFRKHPFEGWVCINDCKAHHKGRKRRRNDSLASPSALTKTHFI